MVRVGVRHHDPRKAREVTAPGSLEHADAFVVIAPEPGVDDHQLVAGVEQVGVAAGRELEAPETDPVRDPNLLDVGEEAVALGLAEATARREAGLEGPGRVASPVLESPGPRG